MRRSWWIVYPRRESRIVVDVAKNVCYLNQPWNIQYNHVWEEWTYQSSSRDYNLSCPQYTLLITFLPWSIYCKTLCEFLVCGWLKGLIPENMVTERPSLQLSGLDPLIYLSLSYRSVARPCPSLILGKARSILLTFQMRDNIRWSPCAARNIFWAPA
jgi:hypothetical protein